MLPKHTGFCLGYIIKRLKVFELTVLVRVIRKLVCWKARCFITSSHVINHFRSFKKLAFFAVDFIGPYYKSELELKSNSSEILPVIVR